MASSFRSSSKTVRIQRAVRAFSGRLNLLENLENRRLLDASYHALAGNNSLFQDWEAQIPANNDDWSGVPSITGFRGDGLLLSSGLDPQTALGADDPGVVDVNIGIDPTAFTSGGVGTVNLASAISTSGLKTVAMQGSGTADAPYLKLYLNSSGTSNVRLRFDLIDVDAGAGTASASQQFAIHYRTSSSGDWTNVPEAHVVDAADQTAGATGQLTQVDVTLPAGADGQSTLEVRIMTADAVGSDQFVAVDNIQVTSGAVEGPGIFVFSPTSYNVTEGTASISATIARNSGTAGSITVNYTTEDDTATSGSDYTAVTTSVVFADGEDSKDISIPILNDGTSEPIEQFKIRITGVTGGATVGASNVATVVIADNDPAVPTGLLLNEISVNPPDEDTPHEFVEIRGNSGTSLSNVYVLTIEGDFAGTSTGQVDSVIPLSGATGSNGLAYIGSASGFTLVDGATTFIAAPSSFNTGAGGLENGTMTFVLAYSLQPIALNTDWDADDDGVLDAGPLTGVTFLDTVGWSDGGVDDLVYTTAQLTQPNNVLDAASRIVGDNFPNSASSWFNGDLVDFDPSVGIDNSDYADYNPVNASTNLPAGAEPTPGGANYPSVNVPNDGFYVIRVFDLTVNEDVGLATVTLGRTGDLSNAGSVTVSTSDDTAIAGQDYTAVSNLVVNFPANTATATFTVPITNDGLPEASEAFNITLSNSTGSQFIQGTGTASIVISTNDTNQPVVYLNEVLTDPVGTDGANEYVELKGTPGTSPLGTYLLSIEGEGAAAGTIDRVFNLGAGIFGSNGLLVLKSELSTLTFDPLSGVINLTAFDTGPLENGSNSFLVVYSPTTAPTSGLDFDADNDGVIDVGGLPVDAVILDGIGVRSATGTTDVVYGTILPPLATFIADAATRFLGNTALNDPNAWYYGELTGLDNNSLTYASNTSANAPESAVLTPGGDNFTGAPDTSPPVFVSAVHNYLTVSQQSLTVSFDDYVGPSLAASDFVLTNLNTSATVTMTLLSVSGDGMSATFTFTGTGNSLGSTILTDGHYRIRALAGQIEDNSGNDLAADADKLFEFKNCDFALADHKVDFNDLLIIAQNYNGTNKTFAQGDANYDTLVNFNDLLAVAQRYNTGIAPLKFGPSDPIVTTRPRTIGGELFASDSKIV